MKCIILAGGHGDRLWPLSRKKYPKQFITIEDNHSLFQEAVARNIPFCDEFIIVTNRDYEFIVKNQMTVFQGTTYRCIYEEEGHSTTAAIVMACMELPLSELVFVTPASQLAAGEGYRDALLRAKELGRRGYLAAIGIEEPRRESGCRYILHDGEWVRGFAEAEDLPPGEAFLRNTGMLLFCTGDMMRELKLCAPQVYERCQNAYERRRSWRDGLFLPAQALEDIPALPVEELLLQKTRRTMVVSGRFFFQEIAALEDLGRLGAAGGEASQPLLDFQQGVLVQQDCENTSILSQCGSRAVVANGLTDTVIVNTRDAVYVGKKGASGQLRKILETQEALRGFYETGGVVYRKWGTYEILVREKNYVVRKLTVSPGRTIYAHKHMERTEHWSIVAGQARVTVDGSERVCQRNDVVRIAPDTVHQLSNIGMEPLVFIETSVGALVREEDLVSVPSGDLAETELGFAAEPFVLLQPAYKDFLWGGTRLKERYGKQCEYDILAESWELSAHPAGQSVVAGGRHKGRLFGEYLELIGKKYWGWKCRQFTAFPILVKLIDARDRLSVQVHPGDDYAMEREGQYGKNELWYVVDCEPDACIYCGFQRDVTRQEVREQIEAGTLLSLLNRIPIRPGQAYFIPAGTIHAIGAGSLICEIQQSSDCTYRLYDFDRRDKYGNRRPLHIEKALQVLDLHRYAPDCAEGTTSLLAAVRTDDAAQEQAGDAPPQGVSRKQAGDAPPQGVSQEQAGDAPPQGVSQKQAGDAAPEKAGGAREGSRIRTILCCKYFECTLCQVRGSITLTVSEESFLSILCLDGSARIRTERDGRLFTLDFGAGGSLFLPAEQKQCVVEGVCTLLVTKV